LESLNEIDKSVNPQSQDQAQMQQTNQVNYIPSGNTGN